MPDFLQLPPRPAKPRTRGLTHVIDPGMTAAQAEGWLESVGAHVDLVRLGWGTAYVTQDLERKLAVYRAAGVPVMLGGTLTELAWWQTSMDGLLAWLEQLGIDRVEVSSGTVPMPAEDKLVLIARLVAAGLTVYAEVGEKDPNAILAPYRWVELIEDALQAGAELVVCEGRAGGDAGMYRPDGEVRSGLVDEIAHAVDPAKLVFEAPRKRQQVHFISQLGPDVNLGNVPPHEALALETLRLGLRSDTLLALHPLGEGTP